MKRVIVCGGRDFEDRAFVFDILDRLLRDHRDVAIAHGGAKGADSLAGEWATERNVPCAVFKADWKKDGRAAGPRRNAKMLRVFEPNGVVAFPGGKGTDNMILIAKRKGAVVAQFDRECAWYHNTAGDPLKIEYVRVPASDLSTAQKGETE